MTIKDRLQEAMKEAMKARNAERLDCLRMGKGALLLKEKETGQAITDSDAIATLRAEVKKRQQALEQFQELGKLDAAEATKREIAILEEFLPQQLNAEALEAKVRAYLSANPEVNHAGKLTGAMKKELGDLADGKLLSEICRKALEG